MNPMKEDVLLGEKLPFSILFDFSFLIALQSYSGVFVLVETLPTIKNAASRLVLV
jgi:hypothetical protein